MVGLYDIRGTCKDLLFSQMNLVNVGLYDIQGICIDVVFSLSHDKEHEVYRGRDI